MASYYSLLTIFLVIFTIFRLSDIVIAKSDKDVPEGEKWKKKDIRDYTDADLERLYDQWEEDEEPLEEDELPEHLRPKPKVDMSQFDPSDPEGMLKMSKKGQTLMLFATVTGNPSQRDTEEITKLWQTSLFNGNLDTQRYVVGDNRALFVVKDGSKAWEIKDFLVSQENCEMVTIEGKDYHGKGHKETTSKHGKKKKEKTKEKTEL